MLEIGLTFLTFFIACEPAVHALHMVMASTELVLEVGGGDKIEGSEVCTGPSEAREVTARGLAGAVTPLNGAGVGTGFFFNFNASRSPTIAFSVFVCHTGIKI